MWKLGKNLSSQRGSAMILALTAVALLGLMASATMTIAGILATETQRRAQHDSITSFAQSIETIVTDPDSCKGTNSPGGPNRNLIGLQFMPGGSQTQTCNAACIAKGKPAGGNQLNVAIGMPFASDTNKRFATAGQKYTNLGIEIKELFLRNLVTTAGATSTTVTGELMAQLSSINPPLGFAPRLIGQVSFSLNNGSNALTACRSAPSAQSMCEQMQCVYNTQAAPGAQRCTCGFPDLQCSGGSYIKGYNPATQSAVCQPVGLNCAVTKGPGFFFAGIDSAGNPVCLAVEGGYGNPAVLNSPTCLAGGESVGAGQMCNAGDPGISAPVPQSECCSGYAKVYCPAPNETADIRCSAGPAPTAGACWVGSAAGQGECAPASNTCAVGATTTANCFKNTGGGTYSTYTDTLTCTAVASTTDPSCQKTKNWVFCFAAGTKVRLADGADKNIEDIKKGDVVLAYDEALGEYRAQPVVSPIHHPEKIETMFTLVLESGTEIRTNGAHRIYLPKFGSYFSVDQLTQKFSRGEEVEFLTAERSLAKLKSFSTKVEKIKLYNLSVGTNHNYFAEGVLVHNEKRECDVQDAEACEGSLPAGVCYADYTYPRFERCNGPEVFQSVLLNCMANNPSSCPL